MCGPPCAVPIRTGGSPPSVPTGWSEFLLPDENYLGVVEELPSEGGFSLETHGSDDGCRAQAAGRRLGARTGFDTESAVEGCAYPVASVRRMEEGTAGSGQGPTAAQRRVIEHREGAMLVTGPAGSGRSEALARRLAHLAAGGTAADRVLVVTRSRAAARRMGSRAADLIAGPYEELWISTYEVVAERLLRQYALEAGLDPFFATVRLADRLAMLLDRLDDLSLRRHEIRGNPAGLLAGLLRRVDALKAEGVAPGRLRDWAEQSEREAKGAGERERAKREREFADFYASHDRVLRECGSLDGADLVVELGRLLGERADVRSAMAERFRFVMVDELEDAGSAHRALLEALAAEHGNLVCACDAHQSIRRPPIAARDPGAAFLESHPNAKHVVLDRPLRFGGAIDHAAQAVTSIAATEPVRSHDEVAERGGEAGAGVVPDPGDSAGVAGSSPVRFWRCMGERAEAQSAAREIEHLLAAGEVQPEEVCVIVGSGWREARLVAAALEERAIPFRFAGEAALFQRPEVRDVLAWLRMLADPTDSAAAVRALTRPPIELRSIDLARCTAIARRRKLDMVSAIEAALESPQLPPEARDRIQAFLKLHGAASRALEEIRADVFVRRLIERIGIRRQRLFVATPEAAERLQSLSRLSELAAAWTRREPRGSVRDFVRHLTAVADAGELETDDAVTPPPGAVVLAEPEQVKGLEFDRVYLLGLDRGAIASRGIDAGRVPAKLLPASAEDRAEDPGLIARARLAYVAMTRARGALVLSWPKTAGEGPITPSAFYEAAREALGAEEEIHEQELFGPAEGLHSTYRMLRDEVLESSWRAGSALSEMRLDTAEDVTQAVARYLELIKLAALVQRPGSEPAAESLAALNELLGRAASAEQRAALGASALDDYVIGEERDLAARRDLVAARREPSLEQFIPRRGDGLALSASDIDLYRTCPLKYKFARVFAIPQEPTINQRFGILIHQVLDRFHTEALHADNHPPPDGMPHEGRRFQGSLDRLLALFEAGWRRTGFGSSDDELQYRDRAVAALARYHERHLRSEATPVWLERSFAFSIGPHRLRGRVDRVDRLPDGGYELIDYKTGERRVTSDEDVQLALYRLGAREAWEVDARVGSYWYVLEDERVEVPPAPDDAERVERTVLQVGTGIEGQDFEPRPSYEICSWCDYRLICPASEA
jgi:superfamily I DNA/RNA helicase/RecB family exonuclease